MPRFHFNIYDGTTILDEDGTELENQMEAQLEAIRYAGEVIKDERKSLALGQEWRMEVTDDAGLVLFRLDFVITPSAAAKPRPLGELATQHRLDPGSLPLTR